MPNHRQKVHFRYNNKFKSDQSYTTRWETRSPETETGRLVLLLEGLATPEIEFYVEHKHCIRLL